MYFEDYLAHCTKVQMSSNLRVSLLRFVLTFVNCFPLIGPGIPSCVELLLVLCLCSKQHSSVNTVIVVSYLNHFTQETTGLGISKMWSLKSTLINRRMSNHNNNENTCEKKNHLAGGSPIWWSNVSYMKSRITFQFSLKSHVYWDTLLCS